MQYTEYDPMNRLKEQVDERGVHTRMGYDGAGNLLKSWDANNNLYTYEYDASNRRQKMIYPDETPGTLTDNTTETWSYDIAGNLTTHKVRSGAVQTFAPYDNRNRATSFSWSDNTQGQSFDYDDASRLTRVSNAEADITYGYDDANRKLSEKVQTKSYGLNSTRTVSYAYDEDGNRERITYPQGNQYLYGYTERNQLDNIQLDPALFGAQYQTPMVKYVYDVSGNRTKRMLWNGAHADCTVDDLNRISSQTDFFTDPKTIRFDYGFDPLGRRQYEQRDGAGADGFKYNARDELTGYNRDGTLGGTVVTGGSTVMSTVYDVNGNRTKTTANGGVTTFVPNNLNEYASTSAQGTLGYDQKGNLTTIQIPGWTYTYDAQNRLTALDSTTLNVHIRQHYDPLNRIIARDNNGVITSNVWDGWNLVEERNGSGAVQRAYLYGAAQNEVVEAFGGGAANMWYWQDGRGNTAAVSGDAGRLLERYRYGWQGNVSFYDPNNASRSASLFDTRFLFAGSLYQPESGLYDMRNRFYHPTLSRFLQTDPIGFKGDALNLYRYCGNDPVNRTDPMGLVDFSVWSRLMWWQSGSSFSYLESQGIQGLTKAEMATADKSGRDVSHTARAAGEKRVNEIGDLVNTSKSLGEDVEYGSEIGRAVDNSHRYITAEPHRGNGVGKVDNGEVNGKYQNTTIDQKHLPPGYKLVGFVLGHVYTKADLARADLEVARKAHYELAIIVSPKSPSQRRYPTDVYDINEQR